MKKIKSLIKSLPFAALLVVGAATATVGLAVVDPAMAQQPLSIGGGAESARGNDQPADLVGQTGMFKKITDVMLFIIGAVSVIMLIIGGLRYVVSGGDQNAVTGAKNTILYAVIGIIVALLAYAVINFVTTQFVEQ